MALSFIKRVFTFGKPAEEALPETVTPEEVATVEAELEPKPRTEDLPVAADPVAPTEIETAGGPSADVEPEIAEADEPALLAGVEATSDIGVVPLSLLQAEAEAEIAGGADAPPSVLPDISPSWGEIGDAPVSSPSHATDVSMPSMVTVGQTPSSESISPLEGEMFGRTEDVSCTPRLPPTILPA